MANPAVETKTRDADPTTPARRLRFETVSPPLFVVLWSSAFVAGIVGVDAAPPLLLTFGRFAIAGVLLAAVALAVRAPWPRGRALGHVMAAGLFMQALQFGSFYTALDYGVPAAVIALVQGLSPVVIALLAGRLLGERVNRRHWWGVGLGAIGVVLAVSDRVSFTLAGILLCGVGLVGLTAGTLYQKRFVPNMEASTGTALQFLVSAPVVAAASLLVEPQEISDPGRFGASLAWLVLVNSVAVFLLLNTMLRRSSASRVSTLFFLTPATTGVMAWLTVGQSLHPLAVVGLVVGGAGVLVANLGAAKKSPK
ncbi:MAG: DMT family transporter [Stackebrandtia sp.]